MCVCTAWIIRLAMGMLMPALAGASTVHVASGLLQGSLHDGVDRYLGIPYAAPPTGFLRWAAPQPARAWAGVRPAIAYGASCPQALTPDGFGPWSREYVVQGAVSEDCLTLNIWTPSRARHERLPVMVWIHGGAFVSGSGSVAIYDGEALARHGVVVVTINYRLGPLGFAAFEELANEGGGGANFGLQDMVAALRWVHENIHAFGGDAARVTMAGQSAGAMAVHQLLDSRQAKGLFSRAIAQSGIIDLPLPTRQEAWKRGQDLKRALHVTRLAQLRAMPAERILAAHLSDSKSPGELYGPVVDGVIVSGSSASPGHGTARNRVPVLVGMTADEGVLSPDYFAISREAFRAKLEKRTGRLSGDLLDLLPAHSDEQALASNRAFTRDYGLASLIDWASDWHAVTGQKAFAYFFSHVEPGPDARKYGAFHSSEIPYVFETLSQAPSRPYTRMDHVLAGQMAGYWVNFIEHGDPNGAPLPVWQAISFGQPSVLDFGDGAPTALMIDRLVELLLPAMRNSSRRSIF